LVKGLTMFLVAPDWTVWEGGCRSGYFTSAVRKYWFLAKYCSSVLSLKYPGLHGWTNRFLEAVMSKDNADKQVFSIIVLC
jgi:hypothetical protein